MPCNECCPFCQHHPVRVNQLYCAWVSAPKFGLVTLYFPVFKAASYLVCSENRGVNSGKWKWLSGTYFSSFKSKIILLRVHKKNILYIKFSTEGISESKWLGYFTFHVTYIARRAWCNAFFLSLVQFSSVAQSCPTLCDPMSCSTPELAFVNSLKKSVWVFTSWKWSRFILLPTISENSWDTTEIRRDTCRRDP